MNTQDRYDVGGVMFARPFKAVRLGHLGLWCENTEGSPDRLVDMFGLRQTERLVGKEGQLLGCFTTCNTDHHALVAIDPGTADPVRRQYYDAGVTLNQISFQVNSLREVNEAHRFFKKHGVKISRIGRDLPGSNWAVYAFDPDGHRVELFYGMEQVGWNGVSKPETMYNHLPYAEFELPQRPEVLEVQEARDKGIDLLSGFGRESALPYRYDVGGVLLQRPFKVSAVGPVRIFVNDIDTSERFYTGIFGLTKSEEVVYGGERCVFLRAGAEHHSVALIPVALRSRLEMSPLTTLMSFGLRVQTYQQLKDARNFLRESGLKEIRLPVELHPGIDYAVHFMFDELHCVQLYFEMDHFGSDSTTRERVAHDSWPEHLDGSASSFAAQLRQGPLA
ncbi:extradiol dioxygenase [Paraburkholderia sp. 1N]|uniref:Extradiol dioxygenase n=1 Tax=Paraburkholderia solitsugae TaxID=2675748 RepID=A0ABX2C1X0_9BURK|nr:VOC family protein [Paraburkholderia solitsugae]NPT46999.1 extradiol dioxygenase [Paraburkholderia solitsugae]